MGAKSENYYIPIPKEITRNWKSMYPLYELSTW